jgi:hypothetical protein
MDLIFQGFELGLPKVNGKQTHRREKQNPE